MDVITFILGALALLVGGFVAGMAFAYKKHPELDAALAKAGRIKSAIED